MALSKRTKLLIAAAVPLLGVMLFLLRDYIMSVGHYFPCMLYKYTGLLCPGCGNTRAVNHLVHGRILLSLRSNPDIPFLVLVPLGFYIELIADICGKKLRIVPRSFWVWIPIFAAYAAFYVLRNFFPILAPP
ncbi:MAG: DUF2752 domain-containing protein [Ruminococcus sp.]|nr:DUF2752 domain-containing protein [Ruminococcus sp.]